MSAPPPQGSFAAPWEAQVFALVVSLQEAGLFTWSDWAQALGRTIRPEAGTEEAADYGRWLETLERLLAERGVAAEAEIDSLTAAWMRAAQATPHGQPIALDNDPERTAAGVQEAYRPTLSKAQRNTTPDISRANNPAKVANT